jgi:hypothetical protein
LKTEQRRKGFYLFIKEVKDPVKRETTHGNSKREVKERKGNLKALKVGYNGEGNLGVVI